MAAPSELHEELGAVARKILSDGAAGWPVLAEAGWLGLEVPESLGGAGASFAEVAVVLHEMGRAAAASPYLGTAVLSVGALNLLEPNPARNDLLRRTCSGEILVSATLPTGDDTDEPFRLDGKKVSGIVSYVPDALEADRLLLLAASDRGPAIVEVERSKLAVTERPVLDATRSLATVSADGAAVDPASVWHFSGAPQQSMRRLLDRAALAVACDSLGLAEAMLEATVDYAGLRHQFGRPIGSFQAVKHACADMLVQVTVGHELVSAAVRAVAAGGDAGVEDAGVEDASVAVSMAKSYTCSAAVAVAGKAMQLHGGIGYTWESGIHTYLKRALLNRSLYGSPAAHRRHLARRYAP